MNRHLLAALILVLVVGTTSWAQNYSFAVPRMLLEVAPNSDASVTLDYTIEFQCSPSAHPIDIVDIGLPHKGYNIGNMSASINGHKLPHIKKSTEINIGVEVHLDSYAIHPGESGEFHFGCTMPNLIFQDTTNKDNASLQITPTWWGSQYVTGTTALNIVVYLPQSVTLDEALYQKKPFSDKLQLQNRNAVLWRWEQTRMDGPHLVGVSFPKRDLDRVVRMTKLMLLDKWWRENPTIRFFWAIGLFVLFGFIFFRLTSGTGVTVFIFLLGVSAIAFAMSPFLEAIALPVLLFMWWAGERSEVSRRRKYLPPIASVEHGGIKRGLTVPEAAVIMELPLGKVLTLVVFGLLKKGIVRQVQSEPLALELVEDYHGSRSERQTAARENGTVIHAYEQPFLDIFEENPGVPIADLNVQKPMKGLIEKAAERMSGFNLPQTREYYRSIVHGAWTKAKAIGDLSKRTQFVDENLLWLLLDDGYDESFNTWHGRGYHYQPTWTRGGAGVGLPAPVTTGGRTTTGDVAASFAGWSENVTGRLAGTLDPVSLGTAGPARIDLSGVDRVTLDVLESMAESSGSGGGGGGCACAGCACACACAGGGR